MDTRRAAYEARQAELAWRRATTAPNQEEALIWLERAARFTPDDENLRFNIATARLATGDVAGAKTAFEAMAARHAVREAWIGDAIASHILGDQAGALAAIRHALRHFTPDDAAAQLAAKLARAAGLAGFCGLAPDGKLRCEADGPITVRFGKRQVAFTPGVALEKTWIRCRQIHVFAEGVELLGSPIDGTAIGRVEGYVELTATGIRGWAWHPASPDTDPILTLHGLGGRRGLTATDLSEPVTGAAPLSRPRAFSVSLKTQTPWRVTGPDGRDLLGSPLGGKAVIPPAAAPNTPYGITAETGTAVVIPVYRDVAGTIACVRSVLASIGPQDRVIVVNDASPEPDMAAALARLRGDARLSVIPADAATPARNVGFPRAANAGLLACGGRDAVLLNSDTRVYPNWLNLLRDAAHSAADIGSATPLSNDASIFSYPSPLAPAPMPGVAAGAALAALAARVNAGLTVEVPTGNGFCLYLRADCLHAVGLLREDCFAQGYGEENDWTERAREAGWRHIAVPAVYVAHQGGASFGAARHHLLARNAAILAGLHPTYHARVAAWIEADPLRPARTRLARAAFQAAANPAGAVLLISHGGIGGTARITGERAAAIRDAGLRPLLLTGRDGAAMLTESGGTSPELWFTLPADRLALMAVLRAEHTQRAEIHHLLGHHPSVAKIPANLQIPYQVWVHDYGWLCPRLSFTNGAGQFCGEAEASACAACTATWGQAFHWPIDAARLRAASAALMQAAEAVIVPSHDVATRIRRHVPAIAPRITPWEAEAPPPPPPSPAQGTLTVAIIGAISLEKGYELLVACAADAAARRLPLRFHIVGYTVDDEPLLQTGHVTITGRYAAEEVRPLIRASGARFAFLPSIWPETWCFALTEAWQAGFRTAAFAIGTPAERIQAGDAGWLLPLGLPAAGVNDALLRLDRIG